MENINLSMKETKRYEIMQGVIAGRRTMAEASQLLGVRERQGYRTTRHEPPVTEQMGEKPFKFKCFLQRINVLKNKDK